MCNDNWIILTTIENVARAKVEEWEIERFFNDNWQEWDGKNWKSCWLFRGRPKQPRTVIVTSECWRYKDGDLTWSDPVDNKRNKNAGLQRFPSGDITGEIEE